MLLKKGAFGMRRIFALAAVLAAMFAHASGELVATGADMRSWNMGDVGAGALTNTVPVQRTICPWKLYVTNAVKRTQSTGSVFTPTNYIVTATVTVTNSVPTWADFTNTVTNVILQTVGASTNLAYSTVTNVSILTGSRLAVTNRISTATVTNAVLDIAGLEAPWTCIATNGITSTVTNFSTTAAGGSVTLKNSFGDTWTLNLSSGAASSTNSPDLTKLVFPGDLKITATQAERLEFRMVFLTFQR